MARKTVDFNKPGISKLPDNKPVLYKIQSDGGKTNYAGIAKRGRVSARGPWSAARSDRGRRATSASR